MTKSYAKALFLFHRDLRLHDNTALISACEKADTVLPCFILDPRQLEKNPYRGLPALRFMRECLEDLEQQIKERGAKLLLFYGETHRIVEALLKGNRCDAFFSNRDYTPFARSRDSNIQALCAQLNVAFELCGDALIQEPEAVAKSDGTPYTVFTPFFKMARQLPVREPRKNEFKNFCDDSSKTAPAYLSEALPPSVETQAIKGGRAECKKVIATLPRFSKYAEERNFPAKPGTTRLSAYNKFGCCSIRETLYAMRSRLGDDSELIRELYWRDFFTHIAFHFPHVFGGAFHRKYDAVPWENDEKLFAAWCQGRTGFPIVDAGMRELNSSGFMHNRVRMIVASFLTKDLHIDWRWGEKYFAERLIDYDPAVNNGSWQWSASTGCDAQPYFRVFNPRLQSEKYDPECVYIKRWVPELASANPKLLHGLHDAETEFPGYPTPIVDHAIAKEWVEDTFRALPQARKPHQGSPEQNPGEICGQGPILPKSRL